jgi:hypothetical protein
MLRQILRHRASPLPFPSFFPSYCDVSEARSYFASSIRIGYNAELTLTRSRCVEEEETPFPAGNRTWSSGVLFASLRSRVY